MPADQLAAQAAARSPWLQQRLAELVECESPSADTAALNRCAALLADMGAEVFGRPPELRTAGGLPHLLWPAASQDPVLILGHFDTVWPLGTLADWPYAVADGIASGPGVFDMKAGIVQALAAVALLAPAGLDGSVSLLLTSDEEVGSGTSRPLIEERASAAAAVLVCEPSADGGAVKIARKGVSGYRIGVRGRAAHAGLEPERGVNAGLELAHQVLDLARLADQVEQTTVTPTLAAAGSTANTVPETASAAVDVRAWTRAELDRVDRQIRLLTPRLPGATVTVTGGINRYPMEPGAAMGLFELARAAAADVGMEPPAGVRSGGGSDGNLTAALGVPTLDGLGAVGGGPHARTEHADVRLMAARAALLAALVTRIGQAPPRREGGSR
ncbi:MAG TPA: M20/M25/M40 family metallo-hydrolase [Streptosporangiaceae bacterium]|jgi:glutamate carboxypeptidase